MRHFAIAINPQFNALILQRFVSLLDFMINWIDCLIKQLVPLFITVSSCIIIDAYGLIVLSHRLVSFGTMPELVAMFAKCTPVVPN